jgi:hypothetical protein
MARHAREERQDEELATLYEEKARDTMNRADAVRKATVGHQTLSEDNIAEAKRGSR